jgi:hypothetical protein
VYSSENAHSYLMKQRWNAQPISVCVCVCVMALRCDITEPGRGGCQPCVIIARSLARALQAAGPHSLAEVELPCLGRHLEQPHAVLGARPTPGAVRELVLGSPRPVHAERPALAQLGTVDGA